MTEFFDASKLSDDEAAALFDRVSETFEVMRQDILPEQHPEHAARIDELEKDHDLSLTMYSLDDVELESIEDGLATFDESELDSIVLIVLEYVKDDEEIDVADFLLSVDSDVANFFVSWFPDDSD